MSDTNKSINTEEEELKVMLPEEILRRFVAGGRFDWAEARIEFYKDTEVMKIVQRAFDYGYSLSGAEDKGSPNDEQDLRKKYKDLDKYLKQS